MIEIKNDRKDSSFTKDSRRSKELVLDLNRTYKINKKYYLDYPTQWIVKELIAIANRTNGYTERVNAAIATALGGKPERLFDLWDEDEGRFYLSVLDNNILNELIGDKLFEFAALHKVHTEKQKWKAEKRAWASYWSNKTKASNAPENQLGTVNQQRKFRVIEEREDPLVPPQWKLSYQIHHYPPEKWPIMYFFDDKGKVIGLTPPEYRQDRLRALALTKEEYELRAKMSINK